MSFVIAAIMNNKIIMMGDTQLNHKVKQCAIKQTTIKVFLLDKRTLIGITGDFDTHIDLIKDINSGFKFSKLSFMDKKNYIKNIICQRNNNVILATLENNVAKLIAMGKDYGYDMPIEIISTGAQIKVLLPPDVTEEFCKPYVYSLLGIKNQMFSCVEAVSNTSNTVNNKIVGFQITQGNYEIITKNIQYSAIDYKITFNNLEV